MGLNEEFYFLFFCNGKRQRKYIPDAERLRPFPASPGCCARSKSPGGASPPPTSGSQAEVTDCGRAARVVTDGGGPGGRRLEVV